MPKQCWDICWNSAVTYAGTYAETVLKLGLAFNFGWKISKTETGLGSEISTWYQSWVEERQKFQQTESRDSSHFTGQIFFEFVRSSERVQREDRSPRVKGRKKWENSSALLAISLGTMQDSVQTRRRNKQQLQQRWDIFPPSFTRSFPWLCVYPRGPLI